MEQSYLQILHTLMWIAAGQVIHVLTPVTAYARTLPGYVLYLIVKPPTPRLPSEVSSTPRPLGGGFCGR